MKDYYQILGVSRNATDDEIKQAYRRLASEYHPDVSDDPHATEKMAKINEAYTTLKDPSKRASYDQYGSNETQETQYNYNPNRNAYDYSNGFVYHKSAFSFGKTILTFIFILLIFQAVSRIFNYIFTNLEDDNSSSRSYEFSYVSDSYGSNEIYISKISSNSVLLNYRMKIVEIEIPSSLNGKYTIVGLGDELFEDCTKLTTITIPNSIEWIGDNTFKNCSSLTTIYFQGTSEQFSSITIGIGNDYFINASVYYSNSGAI